MSDVAMLLAIYSGTKDSTLAVLMWHKHKREKEYQEAKRKGKRFPKRFWSFIYSVNMHKEFYEKAAMELQVYQQERVGVQE